jgi:hypothetical protein
MVSQVLVWVAMVGAGASENSVPSATAAGDRAAYETAQKAAGQDARAHVRLALWCEAHGMSAERLKHLALAVLYDPSNVLARGLMGLVAYRDQWGSPAEVGQQIQTDPAYRDLIHEYLERRVQAALKPDAQARLAAWCEEKGLKEQAIAHYTEVLRLDPSHAVARRHLGYQKQGNRWIKPAEEAAQRLESEQQKRADKVWRPKLERLRAGLESKSDARRAKAERTLSEITDPRAVPMIWAVFIRGSQRAQLAAVQVLGQIDGPAASNALAALAIFNPSAEVRRRAIETLVHRDPRDVIGRLIALVRKPFKYEVRRPGGPGMLGELFVEGQQFDVRRLYVDPPFDTGAMRPRIFAPSVPFDPYSALNLTLAMAAAGRMAMTPLPGPSPEATQAAVRAMATQPQNAPAILKNMAGSAHGTANPTTNTLNYNLATAAALRDLQNAAIYQAIAQTSANLRQRLDLDIQMVESTNDQITQVNAGVLPVLKLISGQDLGADPEKWKTWWTDQLGYAYQSPQPETKPTFTDVVSVPPIIPPHSSCFAAGTLVHTVDGFRPIESIQVGDRVLSQNSSTGLLEFQPVVAVVHNRPGPTLKVTVDGESITVTGIHRFWKAGQGWTMARELKPGDRLRMIGGVAEVCAVEAERVQPVFNLDVAENRDFFVGSQGMLVHDNSFVQPVSAPFDADFAPTTAAVPSR